MDQNKPKLDVNYSNLEETLQSVIYGMKEEKMLSKMAYRSLLYVVPVWNNEGLNLGGFVKKREMDQNKSKLDVNYSNLERNTANCYIWNERGENAL